LIHQARQYLPLREAGRDAFLKGIDVARYSARALGVQLAKAGILHDPDDIFYLTFHELATDGVDGAALDELVAYRRERRTLYEGMRIPGRWSGSVEPLPAHTPEDHAVVSGIGVSAGVVEGLARVVHNLGSDDLEPDEILVCRTTDPSWAAYFFVAGGALIEIGGPLSHGAIVARELGLPCVISATGATDHIHTGDRIRLDGTTGSVEIVQRAPAR
jgi:phosphohistidine swiveling domain-containing protein